MRDVDWRNAFRRDFAKCSIVQIMEHRNSFSRTKCHNRTTIQQNADRTCENVRMLTQFSGRRSDSQIAIGSHNSRNEKRGDQHAKRTNQSAKINSHCEPRKKGRISVSRFRSTIHPATASTGPISAKLPDRHFELSATT
jgi:hypothetical protein